MASTDGRDTKMSWVLLGKHTTRVLWRALPTALFMLQLTWFLLVFALGLFGVSSSLVMCERIAMTGADDAHESCVTVAVHSHEMCLCSFND